MIYAINEKTKEHRVVEVEYSGRMRLPCRDPSLGKGWRYVQADEDGWIKWEGGECPLVKCAGVDVIYRNGQVREIASAGFRGAFLWGHCGS